MESCCYLIDKLQAVKWEKTEKLTATSIRSLPTSSMLRMTFFSIFTSCESFFARSGPKAPAVDLRKAWPAPPDIQVNRRIE